MGFRTFGPFAQRKGEDSGLDPDALSGKSKLETIFNMIQQLDLRSFTYSFSTDPCMDFLYPVSCSDVFH